MALRIIVLLLVIAFSSGNAQTWKRLYDSAEYYNNKKSYDTAISWGQKALLQVEKELGKLDKNYIYVLNLMAIMNYSTGKYDNSLIYKKEECSLIKKLEGESESYFAVYQSLGFINENIGNYKESEEILTQVKEYYKREKGENHPDYINSLNNIASLKRNTGNYAEAEALYKMVIELKKNVFGENHPVYLKSIDDLCVMYYDMARYSEAEPLIMKNLEIRKNSLGENHIDYINNLRSMAMLKLAFGKYDEAEPIFKQVIELKKKIQGENNPSVAMSMQGLGTNYFNMGRYSESEKILNEALRILSITTGENSKNYADVLLILSSVYKEMGRLAEGISVTTKSSQIYETKFGKDNPGYAKSLYKLAALYYTGGDYIKALSLYEQSLEIYRKKFGEYNMIFREALNGIAPCYQRLGKYKEAESTYRKTLELIKQNLGTNHENYLFNLEGLAMLLLEMGRNDEAESLYKENMDLFKQYFDENQPAYATCLNNLGSIYWYSKKYNEAETLWEKAYDIQKKTLDSHHPEIATTLNNLALVYQDLGKFDKLETMYKQALDLYKNHLEKESYNRSYVTAQNNLAYLYCKLGRFSDAETLYDAIYADAIKNEQTYFPYLNDEEKVNFWKPLKSMVENFYQFGAGYYFQKPEISEKMMNLCLATKGCIINATQKAMRKARQAKADIKEWQDARQYWLYLMKNPQNAKKMGINVDSIEKAASQMEKEISKLSPDFNKAIDTSLIRWRDVQKSLLPGEAAIEIVRFGVRKDNDSIQRKYAFLIIKPDLNYPELVVLQNGDELEGKYIKQYKELLETCKDKTISDDSTDSEEYELYNAFWKEIQSHLKGISTAYISLDGVYNQFNINTLRNPDTKKYILDDLDLRILTSTRDLIDKSQSLTGSKDQTNQVVKLFGDPQFELKREVQFANVDNNVIGESTRNYYHGGLLDQVLQRGLRPLPGTKIEINKISSGFMQKNLKTEEFLGDAALEENVKAAKNPRILHIATHGIFLQDVEYLSSEMIMNEESKKHVENPLLRSMLLFAGAENTIKGETNDDLNRDDGILTAYEAMNLDLEKTELVVLSACETGLGEIKNGEGVYGLQRAFQVAGAKSLIMSLWAVSDQATQELMTSFYDKWLSGIDKRTAFRQSQLELKQKYPGFYYWGAFVMVGE